MSKNHHHQKHKQGANQNENKTEDGKTIVPIDPTTDIGKSIEPKLTSCIIESFDGETVDEKMRFVGTGKAVFRGGNSYSGEWSNGVMHGKGVYSWVDGTTYEGDFDKNEMTGKGKYTWSDGSTYVGDVVRGVRHGTGTMQLSVIPVVYEGQWEDGKRNGQGVIYYDENKSSKYAGGWSKGKRSGKGILIYETGNVYEGEWSNDQKNGQGKMVWNTLNQVYEGSWKDDKPHGKGEHVWNGNGEAVALIERQMCNRYVGEFQKGLRHGKGSFFFANGSRYHGEFKENLKHGHGVYSFPDGRVYEGPFKEDRMAFVDGSLEEKSPTKGPVRSPMKGKKSKLGKSSTGANNVLAGASRNVQLNVNDLMPNMAPRDLLKERRAVDNVVMRWNTDLKRIYNDYATKVIDAPHAPNTFTMSLSQFWRFCRDCDLIQRSLPPSSIDRCFHEARVQLASAVVVARRRREASERGVSEHMVPMAPDSMYLEKEENIHTPDHPILFREFVEVLARIANRLYEDVKPLLSEQLQYLLSTKIGRERSPSEQEEPRDEIEGKVRKPSKKMSALLKKYDVFLKGLYLKYSHCGDDLKDADRTMYIRDFVKLLQKCNVVYSANSNGPEKEEEDEAVEDAANTTQEENIGIDIARMGTISITEASQVYLKSRYSSPLSSQGNASENPETNGKSEVVVGSGNILDVNEDFDANDDESNFAYELLYHEFVESLARVGYLWHEQRLAKEKYEVSKLAEKKELEAANNEESEPQENGDEEAKKEGEKEAAEVVPTKDPLPDMNRLSTLGALRRLIEDGLLTSDL